jgi:hypothetical protein
MLRGKFVLAACAIILVTGCGSERELKVGAPSAADVDCNGPGLVQARSFGGTVSLTARYASNAGAVATWQEQPRTPGPGHTVGSVWRDVDPATPVSVCVYDGTFPSSPGGPGPGVPKDSGTQRLILEVSNGQATLDLMGPIDKLSASGP